MIDQAMVLFSLDDQRYALPLERVQRSIRVMAITPLPKAPAIVIGIVDIGGLVIPVLNMRVRLNHTPRDIRLSDQLILATAGKRTVALLVDTTTGVLEPSPGHRTPADDIAPRLEPIDGTIQVGDGLILIHDLERLLSLDEETEIDRAVKGATP